MSKIIKLLPEHIEKMKLDFAEALGKLSVSEEINFKVKRPDGCSKANLVFDEVAWLKMQALISYFESEVAWHGLVEKTHEDGVPTYTVKDILVYPQTVTGATVNTDQEKYQQWLMSFNDEDFNKIRFQGHSHVRMRTDPSSVDLTHQDRIISQLEGDMFYIFVIWNKRGEKTVKIYDLEENTQFDTKDVVVSVNNNIGIERFIQDSKSMVVAQTTTYTGGSAYQSPYQYGNGTTSYKQYTGTQSNQAATPTTQYRGAASYCAGANVSSGSAKPEKAASPKVNSESTSKGNKAGKKKKGKNVTSYEDIRGLREDDYYGTTFDDYCGIY